MSCNSRSTSLRVVQQRLRLFIASMILASVGCSKGSDSPPNDNAVAKGPIAVPADAKQDVAIATPPQWPPLPESSFAATQQELVASLHSQLRNVKLTPTAVGQLTPNMKSHKYRVEYYGEILTDLREFETSIDESCAVSVNSLREQFSQMMSDEEALQNKRLDLLNSRLDWYSKNNPDASEVNELKEIQRTTEIAQQSVRKSKQLLMGEKFQSVKMVQDFLATIAPLRTEFPVLHDAFAACLAPFQSAMDSTTKLKPDLVKWVSGSINTELTELLSKQTELEPQLALEELRLETMKQVRDNEREKFSGSDEEWKAFRVLLSTLKKAKPGKMPKTAFETCMASKLFAAFSTGSEGVVSVYGIESVGNGPLTNEQFQAAVLQIVNEERVKPLRAQLTSINRDVEVYRKLNAEIQRLSNWGSPSSNTSNAYSPVADNSAEPIGLGEPAAVPTPSTPDRPIDPNIEEGQTIKNSIGMKFSLIPSGTFMMGSPTSENGRDGGEVSHSVTISKDFYLGTYEVTQEQYLEIMKSNGSTFKGPNLPAADMTWHDATQFCSKLTSREKKNGHEYRLPTEAEWEYACRAGTVTAYCSGDTEKQLADVAWYKGNSGAVNHPIGQKLPNAWGLYDMHGNVWEWCSDGFQDYPHDGETIDPVGALPKSGFRVCRGGGAGGAFASPPQECRSAHRQSRKPDDPGTILGFRAVLVKKTP